MATDLEALYNRHALAVYRQALGWTRGDSTLAEEVTADAFLRAAGAKPHFQAAGQERRWLLTTARRLYVDRVRRQVKAPSPAVAVVEPDRAGEIIERLYVRSLIARLSPEQQAVVRLRFQEDMDFEALGQRLGISEAAARARLHRALEAIRRAMAADEARRGEGQS